MERLALQLVGGVLYLANKIALDLMERRREPTKSLALQGERFWFWKRMAWKVYLLGLLPIVFIFLRERNWLFAAIELGGAPAMLCGIIAAMSRREAPKWLDRVALLAIPVGLGYSLYDFGGITTLTQLLEIAGSAGFLAGTYLLSKDRQSGYGWFMLMNVATGALFYVEGYLWMVPQQALSIFFIWDARRIRIRPT